VLKRASFDGLLGSQSTNNSRHRAQTATANTDRCAHAINIHLVPTDGRNGYFAHLTSETILLNAYAYDIDHQATW
jgi:hypothetical protein